MSYPVKIFRSTDTGAPTLSGTAGALVALLDACLINGYNSQTLDSITRSGSTATATKSGGHGYNAGDIVLIAGAAQSEYNGEQKILTVTSTTFTYTVSGSPATPATGTITAKMAPQTDWSKAFSGTNKAAYKSGAAGASGCYLRVDDTAAQTAVWRGYESMSDVDTGGAQFPTTTQLSGGIIVRKSDASSGAARPWILICDSLLFYLFAGWASSSTFGGQYEANWFGDPITFKAGDTYHSMIGGSNSTPSSVGGASNANYANLASQPGQYMARSYSQIGSAIQFTKSCPIYRTTGICVGSGSGSTFPNAVDNALHVRYPIDIWEGTGIGVQRGVMAGLYDTPQNAQGTFNSGDTVSSIIGLSRKLLAVKIISSGSQNGMFLMDMDGPWR